MSLLYVVEDGAHIGIDGGVIKITHKDKAITKVPKETVESVAIFGNSQLTTQCIQFCLKRGIRVNYFSKTGSYFGQLISTGHINAKRQKNRYFYQKKNYFHLNFLKD